MFEQVTTAPPDAILGLTEAFNADVNPNKINLSVGVYKDANGTTPVLGTVKEAERRLLETEKTKSYKPMTGDPAYGKLVRALVFGDSHDLVAGGRAITAHTPGGTGALRVAGDYLHRLHPEASIWLSDPTWANHNGIFTAAGLNINKYAYFDASINAVNFDKMFDSLKQIPAGDVVLLHGCCHNPTGADPTVAQWEQLGDLLAERGITPLVDFAYQGLGDGIDADAAGVRALAAKVDELFVCTSFSKNFGLYNERTGALTVVCKNTDHAAAVASQVKITIRTNYSNPPAHGAAIVTTVLDDADLRAKWEEEVADMRHRINGMRQLFVEKMHALKPDHDFGFIVDQRGMFSFSGLTREQVETLKTKDSIYIVGSGRINVAGMTESNMDALCEAITRVL
ncbi:aspartate/tyrosine/aromatic aminotransferase [Planctomycetales bacterium ZRK34]|nr:aspartate/tyrosine/aromatic aminotransferase [Planctomycetales bacterium ZRK34]